MWHLYLLILREHNRDEFAFAWRLLAVRALSIVYLFEGAMPARVALPLISSRSVRAMSMSQRYQGGSRELDPFRSRLPDRELANTRTCSIMCVGRTRHSRAHNQAPFHDRASLLLDDLLLVVTYPNHDWSGLIDEAIVNGRGKVPRISPGTELLHGTKTPGGGGLFKGENSHPLPERGISLESWS